MTPTEILGKLTGVKAGGSGWMARCPGHEDSLASLAVSEGNDGRVLLYCHAGCSTGTILGALGLALKDLFPPKDPPPKKEATTFDYLNADGVLVYQVCRFPPKDFRQRRPDGEGGWVWKMTGVKRLPFRLPELQGVPVVVVAEGEKDVNRLWSVGIPATCNAGGAGKWGASETKALREAGCQRVIILPDNDKPGLNHAEGVASRCKAAGMATSIILLPGLPNHGDVSDWLNSGRTVDELQQLLHQMPYVVPPTGTVPAVPAEAPQVPQVTSDGIGVGEGPAGYAFTDLGSAEAFRDRFGNTVRYDHQRGQWLVWDEHYWRPDADELAYRLSHQHARAWQMEALTITDYGTRKKVEEFTLKLEKRSATENCLAMAKSLLPIASDGAGWDVDPWLLGCPNGVVDLRTGTFRPGERGDRITQQVGTLYDPEATCPRWELFIEEVFEGNAELITFVHKALGYSLTSDMREQVFFMAHGSGANGKSIFLDTLESVCGTYGHRADMRIFAGGSHEQSAFHFADFRGRRLIFASEVKPHSRMNEHTLKAFTGGESLRVERKYGDPFTIKPVGKIWMAVNHFPKVSDDSYGFWRRVRLIPFTRIFAGSGADRDLYQKLRAEASGILRWCINGCLAWQATGLDAPLIVQMATDSYQASEDPLTDFFDEWCEYEKDSVETFPKLFAAYREWAREQGLSDRDSLTSRAFVNNLGRRPVTRVKVGGSTRYTGIRLRKRVGSELDL